MENQQKKEILLAIIETNKATIEGLQLIINTQTSFSQKAIKQEFTEVLMVCRLINSGLSERFKNGGY